MTCPHCGAEMIKEAIQLEDCSGWVVGWICECEPEEEHIQVHIYAGKNWAITQLMSEEEEEYNGKTNRAGN